MWSETRLRRPAPASPAAAQPHRSDAAHAANPHWARFATAAQCARPQAAAADAAEREAEANAARAARGAALAAPSARPPAAAGGEPPVGGEALHAGERAAMEARFGADFGDVRVHADAAAASAARGLGATAFTVGEHIAFAAGAYRPGSEPGRALLAHELTHVLQQRAAAPALQRQDAPAAATPPPGTLADVRGFVDHPGDEPDATLAAAMRLWDRYRARVTVAAVTFRVLPEGERESHLGSAHRIGGRSTWEGATPVIELPQAVLDDIAGYLRVRGTPAASVGDTETPDDAEQAAQVRVQRAPLERAHEAVRLIGHELYHLYRERSGHPGNPVQPVFEREAQAQLAQVRANWVAWLRDAPPASLRAEGIPAGTRITRWEDIPQAVRDSIEQGTVRTMVIDPLYQRSAYLVEEIYTKIEELSYLRVQQRDTTASIRQPSLSEVSQLANLIYFLHNVLHSQADDSGLLTPALLAETDAAILAELRRRYPAAAGRRYDAYEVVFYLSAINGGLPPHYDSAGHLLSRVPGARLPP